MTKPLPLSGVAQAVISVNAEWDAQDIDDLLGVYDAAVRGDTSAIFATVRRMLKRNLNSVQSQTYLLSDKYARAESIIMDAKAAEKAKGGA